MLIAKLFSPKVIVMYPILELPTRVGQPEAECNQKEMTEKEKCIAK